MASGETTDVYGPTRVSYADGFLDNATIPYEDEDPYFPHGTYFHPHWRPYREMLNNLHPAYYYGLGLYMAVVGIVGTLGNLIVITLFIKTKSLRTPPNMFIISLATSDMGFCATNGFPLMTVASFQKIWRWGPVACELYALAGSITGFNSIATLALISMDRYMVIAKPFYALKHVSRRRSLIQIILAWIWAFIWSAPPLLRMGYGRYIPEGLQCNCTFDYLSRDIKNLIFVWCMFVFGFFIPVFAIACSYIGIIRAVGAQASEMRKTAEKMGAKTGKTDKEKKQDIAMAKIAACTIGLFIVSWTPYAAVSMIGIAGNRAWINPFVSQVPVMFAKASAMWNPILYALSHPKFRASLEINMPWLLVCKGRNIGKDDPKSTDAGGQQGTKKGPARQVSVMSTASMETDIEMTSVAVGGISTICDKTTKPMDANNSNSTHLRSTEKINLQEEIATKVVVSPPIDTSPEEPAPHASGTEDETVEPATEKPEDSTEPAKPKMKRKMAMRHIAKALIGFKPSRKKAPVAIESIDMDTSVHVDGELGAHGDKLDTTSIHSARSGAEKSWDVPKEGLDNPNFSGDDGIQPNESTTTVDDDGNIKTGKQYSIDYEPGFV